jgi:hypothetical protein
MDLGLVDRRVWVHWWLRHKGSVLPVASVHVYAAEEVV